MSHRLVHPNGDHHGTQANHQQCLWVHWPVSLHQICYHILYISTVYRTYTESLPLVCISWLGRWLKRRRTQKLQRKCAHCYLKDESEAKHGAELCENCKLRNWLSNYRLNDVDSFSLFKEFLEMGMYSTACPQNKYIQLLLKMILVNFFSFLHSDPVQLYHHFRGSVSSGSSVSPPK